MKNFWRRISPKAAVEDFASEWGQPNPYRWQILGVACALTFALMVLMIPEGQRIEPRRPDITYITTLDENRTDAEIIAMNCANQRLKDEIERRLAEREELRKDIYKALGKATFVDVEEIEAEIEADEASASANDRSPEGTARSIEEYCTRATAN